MARIRQTRLPSYHAYATFILYLAKYKYIHIICIKWHKVHIESLVKLSYIYISHVAVDSPSPMATRFKA